MLTNKNASMPIRIVGNFSSIMRDNTKPYFSQKAFVYVEATSPRIRYQIKTPSKV